MLNKKIKKIAVIKQHDEQGGALILSFAVIAILALFASILLSNGLTSMWNVNKFKHAEQAVLAGQAAVDELCYRLSDPDVPDPTVGQTCYLDENQQASYTFRNVNYSFFEAIAEIVARSGEVERNIIVRLPYIGSPHPLIATNLTFEGGFNLGYAQYPDIENQAVAVNYDDSAFTGTVDPQYLNIAGQNLDLTKIACGFDDEETMIDYFQAFYEKVELKELTSEGQFYAQKVPVASGATVMIDPAEYQGAGAQHVLVYAYSDDPQGCVVDIDSSSGSTYMEQQNFVVLTNCDGEISTKFNSDDPSQNKIKIDNIVLATTGNATLKENASFPTNDASCLDAIWILALKQATIESVPLKGLRTLTWANELVTLKPKNQEGLDFSLLLPLELGALMDVGVNIQSAKTVDPNAGAWSNNANYWREDAIWGATGGDGDRG